jgi:hypothetical protein
MQIAASRSFLQSRCRPRTRDKITVIRARHTYASLRSHLYVFPLSYPIYSLKLLELRFLFAFQPVRANHLNVLLRIRRYVIISFHVLRPPDALKSQHTRGVYYCTKLCSLLIFWKKVRQFVAS